MYQLVFKGERVAGVDENTARANAMALFKATIAQVDRMFSGQAVVIRNKLDEDTANKYLAVLRKHGMICYIEPMTGGEVPEPAPSRPEPSPAAGVAPPASAQTAPPAMAGREERTGSVDHAEGAGRIEVEPGDRLAVAGDKVDDILSHSSLKLDPVGVRISEQSEAEAPVFEHLDDWSLAPVGSDLGEQHETPPAIVPDVSHLKLVDEKGPSG